MPVSMSNWYNWKYSVCFVFTVAIHYIDKCNTDQNGRTIFFRLQLITNFIHSFQSHWTYDSVSILKIVFHQKIVNRFIIIAFDIKCNWMNYVCVIKCVVVPFKLIVQIFNYILKRSMCAHIEWSMDSVWQRCVMLSNWFRAIHSGSIAENFTPCAILIYWHSDNPIKFTTYWCW